MPPALSSLLVELDIHLPPDRTSSVLDHFHYDASAGSDQHDVLLLSSQSPNRADSYNFFSEKGIIAFPRAVGQELGSQSPLLTSILRAKDTSYTYGPKEDAEYAEDPFAVGSQISLVTALQARNSARFTVFGSAEALEDQWLKANVKAVDGSTGSTINRVFARQVSAWTFQELGVLSVGRVEHRLKPDALDAAQNASVAELNPLNPSMYRIKNVVVSEV